MVTQTLTTDGAAGPEDYTRIVRVIRNMRFLKTRDNGNTVVPVRTETYPSPMKQSASNRQPGQSHTRPTLDGALTHELAKARYLMDDLADHVFGHIVSTALARDILHQFVVDGIVQVFKRTASCHKYRDDGKIAVDLDSEDVQRAIEQAFENADMRDCIRQSTERNDAEEPEPSSTDTKKKGKQNAKGEGKQKEWTYSFKWNTFPGEPINEDELVTFLNDITDRAFVFAQPKLANSVQAPRNRFATRKDKSHPMPLSYEPDGEDMRPGFLLLPVEAFTDDFKTVDPRYLNFTALRLVGEAKNRDLVAGVEQVQRYVRGLRRAQPWVHYVLAITITKDKAAFVRGEGSGTERLELILGDGRGCIEFIRILLGLAFAEDVDLGQNPDIELGSQTRTCEVNTAVHHPTAPNAPSTTTASRTRTADNDSIVSSDVSRAASDGPISSRTRGASATSGVFATSSRTGGASVSSQALLDSSRTRSSLSARQQNSAINSSASSKRGNSEIGGDGPEERRKKKWKTTETVTTQEERVVFFPLRVYGHVCLGLLFTSSSIRGRGTTVFCVLDLSDEKTRLAFKMSWQDLERMEDQAAVMKRLEENPHPNVIVPLKTFNAERKKQMCTTLGAIRGFLEEQMSLVHVENRVLNISISELKRPIKYFWGLHDFVRGLRGALLGHEFLTRIGILHRDISENNIVLGVYPWEERGYLIDFDMAILQDAEEPTQTSPTGFVDRVPAEQGSQKPMQVNGTNHVKGLRTGTFPYISFNVLLGKRHSHFDDVESFLYVLFLFLFSYAGPLPKAELQKAHEQGFVRPTGFGRSPHMRSWPKKYADWADGDAQTVGELKGFVIWSPDSLNHLYESAEIGGCLKNNWPEELQIPIRFLLQNTFTAFRESTSTTPGRRTEVSHSKFVGILSKWLEEYSELERYHSNCPDFKV